MNHIFSGNGGCNLEMERRFKARQDFGMHAFIIFNLRLKIVPTATVTQYSPLPLITLTGYGKNNGL